MKRSTLIALVALAAAALVAPVAVSTAADQVWFPEGVRYPFYARWLGHSGSDPDDWVVTACCFPPDSFNANYNLFNQPVDPAELPDAPGYLEGFVLRGDDPFPIVVAANVPGVKVPIWFTSVSAWNDKWTVAQMQKQGSLRGWADSFQMVEQPIVSGPIGWAHLEAVASGVLEDGRTF